jgi:hypothetical protein
MDLRNFIYNNFTSFVRNIRIINEYMLILLRNSIINYFNVGKFSRYNKTYNMVEYFVGASKYKILFPSKRGPSNISKIYDENNVDVTNDILEFAGPSRNFHGCPVSVDTLGHKQLRVCKGESEKVYTFDEIIVI